MPVGAQGLSTVWNKKCPLLGEAKGTGVEIGGGFILVIAKSLSISGLAGKFCYKMCPSPREVQGTGVEIDGGFIFIIAKPLSISGLVIYFFILVLLLLYLILLQRRCQLFNKSTNSLF